MFHRHVASLLLAICLAVLLPAVARAGEPDGKSGVTPQTIKLPSGPGSVTGAGQSFEPDLNTGMPAFAVPLEVPPGRGGHRPQLTLAYNGGWGQGEVGLGWRLPAPCLQRQTDKGLPAYAISDTLIYTQDGQELIPLDDGTLRFKNESSFTRFIWRGAGLEGQVRDGKRLALGQTTASRITTPGGIFMWCVDSITDPNNNVIGYHYIQDGSRPYLSEIRYAEAGDGTAQTVQFTYEPRPDVVVSYQSRYPVTTSLRLKRIEMLTQGRLVRAYRLEYHADPAQSLLASVTQIGSDDQSTLPPLTFAYTAFAPQTQPIVTMTSPPSVAPGDNVDLVLLDNDPLPDLIATASGDHRYRLNLGRGRWAGETVKMTDPDTGALRSPSLALANPGVFMMDVDGSGFPDLVMAGSGGTAARYFPNRGRLFWEEPVPFADAPGFTFESPNVRLSDQNGDKRVDLIATEPNAVVCWLKPGQGLWGTPIRQPKPDPNQDILFRSPMVKLGDFNGDGLDDLGLVRSRSVSYYPGRGDCLFGPRVDMADPPDTGALGLDRLQIADINADGRADLVYVDYSQVTFYLNLGNRWDVGRVITDTPRMRAGTVLRFADMDGSGTTDLLFADSGRGTYQYLDFAGGVRPNLLAGIDNGLGQVISIRYRSSTDYLVEAREAGQSWLNPMPLALSVVSQVDVTDLNSAQTMTTRYVYRDGAWDGAEHRFNGFEWVDRIQEGDASAPAAVTRLHFDTGLADQARKGQLLEQSLMGLGGSCTEPVKDCYWRKVNQVAARPLTFNTRGQEVRFAYVAQTDTYLYETTALPRHLQQQYEYDDYGNRTRDFNFGQVIGSSTAYGEDELLTYTNYAVNTERWILDRPAVILQQDGNGNIAAETRFYYDGPAHVGLPLGYVQAGNLMRRSQSLGPLDGGRFVDVERNRYDLHGLVTEIQDANGGLRTIEYDSVLQILPVRETVVLGEGRTLEATAAYDLGTGAVTLSRDYNAAATLYTYDAFGRVAAVIRPGDSLSLPTQMLSYVLASPVSSVTVRARERSGQAATRQQASYYDGLGRQLMAQQEAENGRVAVSEAVRFNARGSVAQRLYPYLDAGPLGYRGPDATRPAVSLAYDASGRVVEEREPDQRIRRVQYLPLREVRFDEEDTSPASAHYNTPTTSFCDGLERLRGVQEILGNATLYTGYGYDPLGHLTRVADAQGNVKTQTWDGLGRKREMTDPDAGHRAYSYDDAGNLVRKVDAKGQVVTYRYDAARRIVAEDASGTPGDEIVYHYDADLPAALPGATNTLGWVSYIEDAGGIEAFSYDARGNTIERLRTIAGQVFHTGMQYDAGDRTVSLTYPDGSAVSYAYNAQGLLETIPGFVTSLDYTAAGQPTSWIFANGVVSKADFDIRQRLQRLETSAGSTIYDRFGYWYDGVSNVTVVTDLRPNRTFADDMTAVYRYDSLYRMADGRTVTGETIYDHDTIGNQTRQVSTEPEPRLNVGAIAHGGSAGPHAPTTVGTASYTYDANGNLVSRPGLTLSYDHRDRLIRAETTDGTVLTFLYDAGNQRLLKRVQRPDGSVSAVYYPDRYSELRDGRQIKYVWAGDRRVAQVITAGSAQARPHPHRDRRVYLPLVAGGTGASIVGQTSSALYFLHPDHLGSTRLVTDNEGRVVQDIIYYPYGLVRAQSGVPVVSYTFIDRELDTETNLYYVKARYYDPFIARFISVDAMTERASDLLDDPRWLNAYSYTRGNPVSYVDPTGYQDMPFGGSYSLEDAWRTVFGATFGATPEVAASYVSGNVDAALTSAGNYIGQQLVDTGEAWLGANMAGARTANATLPALAYGSSVFYVGTQMNLTLSPELELGTFSASTDLVVSARSAYFAKTAMASIVGVAGYGLRGGVSLPTTPIYGDMPTGLTTVFALDTPARYGPFEFGLQLQGYREIGVSASIAHAGSVSISLDVAEIAQTSAVDAYQRAFEYFFGGASR